MTDLPKTAKIQCSLDKGWLSIWLATPENRNALSDELVSELNDIFDVVEKDRTIRGVTLRGKGGVFCAGGDLKSFQAGLSSKASHDEIAEMNKRGGALFARVNALPAVVVVLVEGAAIAGGLGLACCADIVAVTKDAKFALTETQLGIVPAQIAPYVVQRFGLNAARRLMLTGARFKGEEAGRLGLADYVVDDAEGFDAIVDEIKTAVGKCEPRANAVTKEIVLSTTRLDHNALVEKAADGFASRLLSKEGREGVEAFLQKRPPAWARGED